MDKYVEEGPIKNDSSAKLKNRKETGMQDESKVDQNMHCGVVCVEDFGCHEELQSNLRV